MQPDREKAFMFGIWDAFGGSAFLQAPAALGQRSFRENSRSSVHP
jgi:hypothetical protein